ncbi:MAG: hypothetical protein MI746_17305 [Pseudomonadales bacterium]|nr:hypothetical protein [Pseudomonadales bacterium]
MRKMQPMLLGVLAGLLVACTQSGTVGERPQAIVPFTPDISINEIMVAQIDHAAYAIWDAGSPDANPTAEAWQEVEQHAIQLISSRAALTMGGTGVNDAMWIAQRSWREYVLDMNEASVMALTSARNQDKQMLTRAGDLLVESCLACHQQFKPEIPTEGYLRGR